MGVAPRDNKFPDGHQMILTARAARRAIINREIMAWIIIKIFAQRDKTIASVGEKAVLVLNAKNK